MKTTFRLASLLSAAVMLFASCGDLNPDGGTNEDGTGNGNGTGNGSGNGGTPTENVLTLEVDKFIIQSNGEDASTLTVKFNGEVLTDGIILFDKENQVVDLGAEMKFTTEEDGEYSFYANYKTYISNTVTVTAVPTPVPETPADPDPSNTSFVRRVLLAKYTGEQCPACPNATAAIHKFLDEHELAPYVVKAEIHTFSSDDPAYYSSSFYAVGSFPTVILDWYVQTSDVNYRSLASLIESRYEEVEALAGISVNSVCENGAVTFKVAVKAAKSGEYRLGAWLLEDNIQGNQKGAPTPKPGEDVSWYHDFDDCLRHADSKSGTSYSGAKFSVIEAGKTAEKLFTWTLKDNWKVENLKLCVFVSVPDDAGRSFVVNNSIYAPLNGIVPFEYAK